MLGQQPQPRLVLGVVVEVRVGDGALGSPGSSLNGLAFRQMMLGHTSGPGGKRR
jgi:hypothetical protein